MEGDPRRVFQFLNLTVARHVGCNRVSAAADWPRFGFSGTGINANGLTWRLANDLSLVAHEKKLRPLSGMLHYCVSSRGLGDVELVDHKLASQMYPAAPHQSWFFCICYVSGFVFRGGPAAKLRKKGQTPSPFHTVMT